MRVFSLSPAASAWIEAMGVVDCLVAEAAMADVVVVEAASQMEGIEPEHMVVFAPQTLKQAADSVLLLGKKLDRFDDAMRVLAGLERDIRRLHDRLGLTRRMDRSTLPAVLCIDAIEPPYVAGCWMQDVIEQAGGRPIVATGLNWGDVDALDPDFVLVAVSKRSLHQTCSELRKSLLARDSVANDPGWMERIYVLDAPAYFSVPGPNLYAGIHVIAGILHPEVVEESTASDAYVHLSLVDK